MSHYLLHEVLRNPGTKSLIRNQSWYQSLNQRLSQSSSPKLRSQLKLDLMLLLSNEDSGPRVERVLQFLLE